MLYLIYQGNHPDLEYRGGQGSILHLQADLHTCIAWAEQEQRRWAFTLSNAGSCFFEDRCDVAQLNEINWNAVQSTQWQGCKEGKQAKFLLEHSLPWHLVERIGVHSQPVYQQAMNALPVAGHRPTIEIKQNWYY